MSSATATKSPLLAKKFSCLPTSDTKQSTKPAWATPKLRSVARGVGPSSLAELLQADQNRLRSADHEKQGEGDSPKTAVGGKAVFAGSSRTNRETGGKDERANECDPTSQKQTSLAKKVEPSTVFTEHGSHKRPHISNGNADNEISFADRKKSLERDKQRTAASVRSPFVVSSKKVGQQNEGMSPKQHSTGETPKSPTRKTSSEHIVLSSPGNSNPNSPTKRDKPMYWKEKTKTTDENQTSKHTEQQNSKETAKIETHDEQRSGQNTRQLGTINTKVQSVGQENMATRAGQRLGPNHQRGGTNTKVQSVGQDNQKYNRKENVVTSVEQIAGQRDEQRVKRPQDGGVRSSIINKNVTNNNYVAVETTKHGRIENNVQKGEEKHRDVSQTNPAMSVNLQKPRSQLWREKLKTQGPEPELNDVQETRVVEDRIVQHPTMPFNREAANDSAEVEKLRTELEKLKTEHESVVGMYKTTINKMKEEMEEMKMMNLLTSPQDTMTPPAAPAPPPPPCPPPPPPPPPGGNIAPSPPPPPGGVGCPPAPPPPGPAPPPPPPGSSIVRPRKACIKPGVEMRPLFWQRILVSEAEQGSDGSSKSRNTVWGNMKEAEFDIKEFQKLFGRKINKRKRANKRKSLHEDMVFDQPEGKQVIKVLENSRSQTIGIIMTSLNCQLDDVKDAIYKMDTNTIDMDGLKALYHIRPRPDEIEVISKEVQDHPEATLDKPEGFLMRLHKMDHFSERLECWLYKDRFTEAVHDVDRRLGAIGEANVHIRTDKEIHFVLSLVLALGNYMNGSTTRGQADGFQIGALMKLKDIKTQDNMMNLLQYIVQLYCKIREVKGPGAEYTLPDPYIVLAGSQSSFKELREDMAQAKITLATCKAKHEIVVREGDAALREPFDSYMNEFFTTADVELSRLSEKHETIAGEFKKITDYFMFKGEQNEEVGPPLFYGIWGHFLEDFKNYWKAEVLQIAKKKFSKTEHLQQIKAVATQFLSRRGSSSKDGVVQAKAAVAAKKTSKKQ